MATAHGFQSTTSTHDPLYYGLRKQLVQRRQRLEQALERGATGQLLALLDEVDAALARMQDGSFGVCEACLEPIEVERLVADPLSRLCIGHLTPEQQRVLEADLELAASLQKRLLPSPRVQCDGWCVAYDYRPAGLVSGDYVDVLTTPDRSLFFALGDVSGKGVAASMLMANLSAMFRALVPLGVEPAQLVAHANRVFCESTLPTQYATLVVGRATPAGEVEIANAGHLEPLAFRNGEVSALPSTGLPIGLFRDQQFPAATVQLGAGDTLALYSDGVSEAVDGGDNEYGIARLTEVVRQSAALGPQEAVAACLRDLTAFRGAGRQTDDQTLLLLRRSE